MSRILCLVLIFERSNKGVIWIFFLISPVPSLVFTVCPPPCWLCHKDSPLIQQLHRCPCSTVTYILMLLSANTWLMFNTSKAFCTVIRTSAWNHCSVICGKMFMQWSMWLSKLRHIGQLASNLRVVGLKQLFEAEWGVYSWKSAACVGVTGGPGPRGKHGGRRRNNSRSRDWAEHLLVHFGL